MISIFSKKNVNITLIALLFLTLLGVILYHGNYFIDNEIVLGILLSRAILVIGPVFLLLITFSIFLWDRDSTNSINQAQDITRSDWALIVTLFLTFIASWYSLSLDHWLSICLIVVFFIQLSFMTRIRIEWYFGYWVTFVIFLGIALIGTTTDEALIDHLSLLFVIAFFKLIEDSTDSVFPSSLRSNSNPDTQTRKAADKTIFFSPLAYLFAYVFYVIFFVFIRDIDTNDPPSMVMNVTDIAVPFYQFALPLHVAVLTIIAPFSTLIYTLIGSNAQEDLATKIEKQVKVFILMYIVILAVLALGFLTYNFINFSGEQDSELLLLTMVANLAFEFSILVMVPALFYVYALITELMKLGKQIRQAASGKNNDPNSQSTDGGV